MSKAEERGKTYALHKASEKLNDYYGNAMLSVVQFDGYDIQRAFTEGHLKAEKDLELTWEKALTWENIKEICNIAFEEACRLERNMKGYLIYKEQHYQEVLKRFKERKDKL